MFERQLNLVRERKAQPSLLCHHVKKRILWAAEELRKSSMNECNECSIRCCPKGRVDIRQLYRTVTPY